MTDDDMGAAPGAKTEESLGGERGGDTFQIDLESITS